MLFYGSDAMHSGLHKKSKGYFLNKQPELILGSMVSSSEGFVVGVFYFWFCLLMASRANLTQALMEDGKGLNLKLWVSLRLQELRLAKLD